MENLELYISVQIICIKNSFFKSYNWLQKLTLTKNNQIVVKS